MSSIEIKQLHWTIANTETLSLLQTYAIITSSKKMQ